MSSGSHGRADDLVHRYIKSLRMSDKTRLGRATLRPIPGFAGHPRVIVPCSPEANGLQYSSWGCRARQPLPAQTTCFRSRKRIERFIRPSARRAWRPWRIDLAPARWIWLPSQRTLPNTFLLFRRELTLSGPPRRATGFITADSRYLLTVNGRRVQWGPAPCDPRSLDADPVDLTALLTPGKNVLGVEVLHYGHGDGTWPAGKPGLIFHLVIEEADGHRQQIVSDPSWQVTIDRAHRPGQFKRWYLRALQEEFDARLHPTGWNTLSFEPDGQWTPAMVLDCPADKPPACSNYPGGDLLERADPKRSSLRVREIPPSARKRGAGHAAGRRGPHRVASRPGRLVRVPHARLVPRPVAIRSSAPAGDAAWRLPAGKPQQGQFVTFEFKEQIVGWPYFTIEAPEGTIVELMCQEAHDPAGPAWLDSQYFNWSRFICRKGVNRFETFDFESLRWLQLHVRNPGGPVVIRNVGVRRRMFDWPVEPRVRCSEPALQRLFDASVNTLRNCAQETCVDGMARERQQYSGDGGHQLLAIRCAMGEPRLSRRFLRTFSEGQTQEGLLPRLLAGVRSARAAHAAADRRRLLGAAVGPRRRIQLRLLEPLPGDGRPGGPRRAVSAAGAVRRLSRIDPRQGRPVAGRESRRARRSGSITSPTSSSGTSSARSISTRRRCSNMPWRRWPTPAAIIAGPRSSPAAAATFGPRRCGGSGAPRGACSSIICPGSTRRRAPGCATARWPRPCCSTSVPTATWRRRVGPWSSARPRWGSPIRATPAGATGPLPGWAVPTWSSASFAAAGRHCRR